MTWKPAQQISQIAGDETHVWLIRLDAAPVDPADLQRALALEELSRADKFYREMDRRRYQVTRFALRDILSRYLGTKAEEITFDYNQYGKPLVQGEEELRFNVSHAGEISLIAVALGREVGVDVEKIQANTSGPSSLIHIARRFFSPNEIQHLLELTETALADSFFTCWTRKEAFIKAKGLGLSIPLDSFEVSFLPGQTPELLAYEVDQAEKTRWSIFHLEPSPGYVGALVVEGSTLELICWNWGS